MDGGDVNVDDFEKSIYFNELYKNRIKYFNSALIMDLISARQIVKFDSNKIKTFRTKLYKLDYMFWKLIKCNPPKADHVQPFFYQYIKIKSVEFPLL